MEQVRKGAPTPTRSGLLEPQLQEKISSALEDLSPREAWSSNCALSGLRLRNIGEILGTSEEAAKNCLFRATQKMRCVLGEFV